MLASIEDINANLDGQVIQADDTNTQLLQISIARIIRGQLSRVLSYPTMVSWDTPNNTPDIIREVAGKLIAAQLYFNTMSRTSLEIEDRHYAQILYNQAMAILNNIIEGIVVIPDVVLDTVEGLSTEDFFPIDNTGRAFSVGMEL